MTACSFEDYFRMPSTGMSKFATGGNYVQSVRGQFLESTVLCGSPLLYIGEELFHETVVLCRQLTSHDDSSPTQKKLSWYDVFIFQQSA
jgi:hypothetical protein